VLSKVEAKEKNFSDSKNTPETSETSDRNPEKEQCPVCKEWDHPYFISRHNHGGV